jgi:hypothetical protein
VVDAFDFSQWGYDRRFGHSWKTSETMIKARYQPQTTSGSDADKIFSPADSST